MKPPIHRAPLLEPTRALSPLFFPKPTGTDVIPELQQLELSARSLGFTSHPHVLHSCPPCPSRHDLGCQ